MWQTIFPESADNNLRGSKLPLYAFALITLISVVRSCIHTLAPDGGAGSIAGMNLSVPGADGIIFAFALWGSAQLIYALLQLLVLFRYQSLIPFMLLIQFLETSLRMLVGHLKPVTFSHTPPGAVQNYVYLPLTAAMLALSIWSAKKGAAAK